MSSEDNGTFRREIRHGQFRRETILPDDVDVSGAIQSKLENGILTVTLPKLKGGKLPEPKNVKIL